MITRRNFLKAGAAVAALSVVPNGFASILAKKEKAIGVQLYSVRDDLKTDFDGTMKALVDIGYKRMEAAGYRDGKFYGKSPAEMKKYLADLGARMVGSHTGSGLLAEGDTKGWDFWKKNAADTAERINLINVVRSRRRTGCVSLSITMWMNSMSWKERSRST